MPATLIAPALDTFAAAATVESEPVAQHAPGRPVAQNVECKCVLAAFGRCPTQLTPSSA
jgi:hypothetical protein